MIVKQHFMAGDIVRYIPMGDKEYVLEGNAGISFTLLIELGDGRSVTFTKDGKISTDHTHPLLILIRRPEEKKKWYQVIYKMVNSRTPRVSNYLYESENDFYRSTASSNVEWVELKFVCER